MRPPAMLRVAVGANPQILAGETLRIRICESANHKIFLCGNPTTGQPVFCLGRKDKNGMEIKQIPISKVGLILSNMVWLKENKKYLDKAVAAGETDVLEMLGYHATASRTKGRDDLLKAREETRKYCNKHGLQYPEEV